MSDDFKYWDKEHYTYKVVSGSESSCMKIFNQEIIDYPTREYGTHICEKTQGNGVNYAIVIRRFKSRELCKKHLEYPPTYIREGRSI